MEEHCKPGGAGQTPPKEVGRAAQNQPCLKASADQHPTWPCLLSLTLTAPQIPSSQWLLTRGSEPSAVLLCSSPMPYGFCFSKTILSIIGT